MRKIKLLCVSVMLLVSGVMFAQNSNIKGTIYDGKTGEPVPFASIVLKGTSVGVASDENGQYTINAPKNGTLIVSSIGFKNSEVSIDGKLVLNITLNADTEFLDDVVVVAYGVAKKESVTGAISSVKSAAIEKRPLSSVSGALEGQAAGVMVNNTYGEPGSDATIRIRGFSSVNGSNAPLYVIDGVPFGGNLSDLNSADIESMTVLKDATSAALYGSRASNGVILITTKRGSSEKVSIKATVNQGVYTRGIPEYDRMGADDFMETMWTGYKNYLMSSNPTKYPTQEIASAEASNSLISGILKYNIYNKADNELFDNNGKLVSGAAIRSGYDDLNWYDYIERIGHRQDYLISGDAASEKAQVYFSVGYLDENGYIKKSDFSRWSGRVNASITPKKWIKAGITLSGSYQTKNLTSDGSASFANPFMYARNIAPIYPVYLHDMETGEYLLDGNKQKQYDDGSTYNRPQYNGRHVIWERELDMDKTIRTTLNSTAFLDIKFLKDFTFSVKADISLRNDENQGYNNAIIGDGQGNKGRAKREIYNYKNYTFQQQLTWAKEFDKHNVDVLIGHENFDYQYEYIYGYKTTEIFEGATDLINFTDITSLTSYYSGYRIESYLGRARYNYLNKYFFEGSYRRDGSSRFAHDKRWGNFWSLGGTWLISKEGFMANAKNIDMLKLRASYGQVGNDASAGYYAYMALYSLVQNGNIGGAYKTQLEANDLVWESTNSFSVALEGRFFDRLNVTLEYFDKRSKDLLFDVYNPLSAGGTNTGSAESTITKNIGSVSNKGIELQADIDIIQTRDWNWNFGVNATWLKNTILSLPEQNRENGIINGTKKYMEGHGLYDFWMYQYVGVDQMNGNALYLPDLEDYYIGDPLADDTRTKVPAEYVTTINGVDYVTYTSYAKKDWSGSSLPKVYGSFNTSLSWKGLDLSALFTYALGGKVIDYSYQSMMSATTNPRSLHTDLLNSWSGAPAGMTETSADRISPTAIPVIDFQRSQYTNSTSTRFLMSGNYLVLKNISLSYSLPKRVVKKMDMQNFSIVASVENAFTLSAKKGMNPQQSLGGTIDNYFNTPRVFTLGLNVKF